MFSLKFQKDPLPEFDKVRRDTWKNIDSKTFEYRKKIESQYESAKITSLQQENEQLKAQLKEQTELLDEMADFMRDSMNYYCDSNIGWDILKRYNKTKEQANASGSFGLDVNGNSKYDL